MQSIDLLKTEHALIKRSLRVAQEVSKKIQNGTEFQSDDLYNILDFIKVYADEFHHKKEEDVLFKWMAERGFPVESGPIQVMLYEHDLGRSLIQSVLEMASDLSGIDSAKKNKIASDLSQFSSLLDQHIFKEDNILYPMAERLALPESDRELMQRYQEKVDNNESALINLKYERIIVELEGKYAY